MSFWGKKPLPSNQENPLRALDPTNFDKGAQINQRARELQLAAAEGLSSSEALTALGTALGNGVAAMVAQYANLSMDEMLELACAGVHESAHIAADLPLPNEKSANERELSNDEFNKLSRKLIGTATANGILAHDAISATARALGTLLSFEARRQGRTIDEMVGVGQQMVAGFAAAAGTFLLENPDADPAKSPSR